MRLAWFDVTAGGAGDMFMSAMAHAGRRARIPAEEAIRAAVAGLRLGASVSFERALRGGLHCLVAKVACPPEPMRPADLHDAIERADASDAAKTRALAGLAEMVGAEARVHGVEPERVHLHEIGSADTAVDLLGAAVGLEALGVGLVAASPVPAPRGWIGSQHGQLPLPAPATLEMLRGVPLFGVPDEIELVTPTAAAILVGHGAAFGPLPPMRLEEVGLGGGTLDTPKPNVCRLLLGRPVDAPVGSPPVGGAPLPEGVRLDHDVLLECNVDDQSPETLGHAIEALMAAGARDAWVTPIVMKKSRPAFLLSVLGKPEDEGALLETILRQTTTLGVRRREVQKWVMDREVLHVPVRGTNVRVKVGRIGREAVTVSPEFDDCLAVATRTGASLKKIFAEASEKARRLLES